MEESQIQKFYKGANVFLTGGTGFLGKTIIEKLLRDTEVETIYVLIREKKGKTAHMRVDYIFDDVVFDRLKAEKPKYRNKVEAIAGDCSITGLGISTTDRQKLISKINIVLHVAATVNFNEQIKLAYNINVNGTKHLLNLARELRNLKSVVHVSTAYSNCIRNQINEEIYDHPLRSSDLEAVLEKMTERESDLCTPKILGDWPNTYTFTKALAESLVKEMGSGLPVGIFRPGMVISTYREPIPGWIDNLYGPTGTAVGAMSGVLRVSFCDQSKLADLVPVDTCVSGLLATAWDVAQREEERKPENIPVYNYVSSPENPIIWEEFTKLNFIHGINYTPSNAIWCPCAITTSNKYLYWILRFLLHTCPAAIFDLFCVLTGGKPSLLNLYKKIHKFSEIIAFFGIRDWKFSNKNTQNLWRKMNKTDQELFPLSLTTVSWLMYFRQYLRGVRKYLLKEDESTMEMSIARNHRFTMAHQAIKIAIIFLATSFITSIFFKIWHAVFN